MSWSPIAVDASSSAETSKTETKSTPSSPLITIDEVFGLISNLPDTSEGNLAKQDLSFIRHVLTEELSKIGVRLGLVMVSFICDACGNTVKKNQVEKHYKTQCRNCSVLSCIDCGVDFPGEAYVSHTSCITEAEKYQGHLYQPKDKENKGEVKQKQWIQNLRNAGDNVKDARLKSLLEKITEYSNIPRKKKKFENFCKNSVKVYDEKTLNALWDAFNASTNPAPQANGTTDTNEPIENCQKTENTSNNGDSSEENGLQESNNKNKKKKKKKNKSDDNDNEEVETSKKKNKKDKLKNNKRKINDDETDNTNVLIKKKKKSQNIENEDSIANGEEDNQEVEDVPEEQNKGKFNWHKAIKIALKETCDKELPVKKLRKKVMSAYQEHGTDNRATNIDECRAMFEKKLKTYSKVKIKKDVAKLIK